jgi:hypothetical protein
LLDITDAEAKNEIHVRRDSFVKYDDSDGSEESKFYYPRLLE